MASTQALTWLIRLAHTSPNTRVGDIRSVLCLWRRLNAARDAIRRKHTSVIQCCLVSYSPGHATTGSPVSASIASRRLYFASRSLCVIEPILI